MFGKTNKRKNGNMNSMTMVSPSTEITGDIKFSGGLWVEGKINGNVSAEDSSGGRLDLAKGGRIVGDVSVPDVHINGEVEGDIYVTGRVELANNAQIKGNVYYNLLEMAMGAAINGKLVHKPKEEIRLLEHKSDHKQTGNGSKSAKVAELKDAKS
jgi:cytoskeletal protein CcmA (bactofilin family)